MDSKKQTRPFIRRWLVVLTLLWMIHLLIHRL